jgi:hypothetical protein
MTEGFACNFNNASVASVAKQFIRPMKQWPAHMDSAQSPSPAQASYRVNQLQNASMNDEPYALASGGHRQYRLP